MGGVTADDTIYALSTGQPPAAIAIVRISGPAADEALRRLAGRLPGPRRAELVALRRPSDGALLDRGLALRFPGPASATGEDMAELHLHGGRAVVRAVLEALGDVPGLRGAEPGEFTRRAFANGRIDLTEAEGLADLLSAETEAQRRAALGLAGGALGRMVEGWRGRILALAAQLEAVLDFSDEGEVGEGLPQGWHDELRKLLSEFEHLLSRPAAERLRDGIRVVIAGPPNAGKSTLFNVLVGREAAITSPLAGTTRDVIEAPTSLGGTAFLLVDTAGLRHESDDTIEMAGVERAHQRVETADILLWLGEPSECPRRGRAIVVAAKADLGQPGADDSDVQVSALTGAGLDRLLDLVQAHSTELLPAGGEVALNARHRIAVADAVGALQEAGREGDLLLIAEALRRARLALDRVTGRAGTEDMLDALFARFCVGK